MLVGFAGELRPLFLTTEARESLKSLRNSLSFRMSFGG